MTLQVLQRWTADFSPILWVFPRDCLLKAHYKHISQIFQSVSNFAMLKGQIMSECIYEIIDFPKYQQKNLIDFYPESLFRLGMLCTHLSRVTLRIIKTNHMYLVYKTFQVRILSNFFGGILENQ